MGPPPAPTRTMPRASKAEQSSVARRMLIRVPPKYSRALGESTELATRCQGWLSSRFSKPLSCSIYAAFLPSRSELPPPSTPGPARAWARELYDAYPHIQGLDYGSSMNGHPPAIVLNDRAERATPKQPRFHRALNDDMLVEVLQRICLRLSYGLR